jgi:hypothetical protein
LRKQKGVWYLTDEGKSVISLGAVGLLESAIKNTVNGIKIEKPKAQLITTMIFQKKRSKK